MAVFYDEEAKRVGNPPGLTVGPTKGAPTTVFLAESLDKGWEQYGPYMLHDAVSYENGWEQAITLRVLAKLLQSLNYEKKRGHIEL